LQETANRLYNIFLINEREFKMGDKGKKDRDKIQKQKVVKQDALDKKKKEKHEKENISFKKL